MNKGQKKNKEREEGFRYGQMPNTDFRYEEFEGLLASYLLSLAPLTATGGAQDLLDYNKAVVILRGFAKKYGVQSPELTIANPRSQEKWGRPSVLAVCQMMDCMSSFYRDFGIGGKPRTKDYCKRNELGRLLLSIFSRHGIAKVKFRHKDSKLASVTLKEWASKEMSDKTLNQVIFG